MAFPVARAPLAVLTVIGMSTTPALARDFSIKEPRLLGKAKCATDIKLNVTGDRYSFGPDSVLQWEAGAPMVWCTGARHTWTGVSVHILGDAIQRISSDEGNPLVFQVGKSAYQYRRGKGEVVLADGMTVELPSGKMVPPVPQRSRADEDGTPKGPLPPPGLAGEAASGTLVGSKNRTAAEEDGNAATKEERPFSTGQLVDQGGKAVTNAAIYEGLCHRVSSAQTICQYVAFAKVMGAGLGFEGAVAADDLAVIERIPGKLFDPVATTDDEGRFRIPAAKPGASSDQERSYFVTIGGGAFIGKAGQCLCFEAHDEKTIDLGEVTLVRPVPSPQRDKPPLGGKRAGAAEDGGRTSSARRAKTTSSNRRWLDERDPLNGVVVALDLPVGYSAWWAAQSTPGASKVGGPVAGFNVTLGWAMNDWVPLLDVGMQWFLAPHATATNGAASIDSAVSSVLIAGGVARYRLTPFRLNAAIGAGFTRAATSKTSKDSSPGAGGPMVFARFGKDWLLADGFVTLGLQLRGQYGRLEARIDSQNTKDWNALSVLGLVSLGMVGLSPKGTAASEVETVSSEPDDRESTRPSSTTHTSASPSANDGPPEPTVGHPTGSRGKPAELAIPPCAICGKPSVGHCHLRNIYVCETHRFFTDHDGKYGSPGTNWRCP
jgi:hypothetical protein